MASERERLFWNKHLPQDDTQGIQRTDAKQQHQPSTRANVEIPIPSPLDPTYNASPLIALPDNILKTIFGLCLYRPHAKNPSDITFVDIRGPMDLTSVCRYWRAVAVNDPLLWSSIHIGRMTENSLKRAHLWFIRSGTTSPLTLGLFRLDIPDLTVEEEIMQLYTQNCHRWHEVFFQFDTQDHPPSLYMLADLVKEPRAAPQLKRMSFRIGRHIMGIAKYDAWSVLSASQELRTLDVMGFLQMEVGFGKNTPWDRLTAATFTNVDIAAVWTILPECGSLQYLNFQPTATRSSDFKYVSMVTLPALRELHLYIAGLKASSILDCLTTPNLSKLKLFHYEGPDPRPEAFHRFLSRSGCMLETLQFIDVSVTEEDFIEYIACPMLSGVTYADIRGELTEGIVRRLTLEESTSNDENDTDPGASSAEDDATATNSDPAAIPIFPSLRRLKLSRCDFSESEPGVFPRLIGEMISSRCQSEERRLTEVYMDVGEYGALEGSEPEGFIDDIYKKYKVEVVFDL